MPGALGGRGWGTSPSAEDRGLEAQMTSLGSAASPSLWSATPRGVTVVVYELLATTAAIEKLGRRSISDLEVAQVPRNRHAVARNPRAVGDRRLLVGRTDGGRVLTLVIEATLEPTTWLVITGWEATAPERKMLS